MAGQLWSFEVLVIKSGEALPYVKAQQGFTKRFQSAVPRQGIKSIVANNIHSATIEKGESRSATAWTIEEDRPDLVVAIGKKALQAALLTDRPVVYLLVPGPGPSCLQSTRPPGSAWKTAAAANLPRSSVCSPRFAGWGWFMIPTGAKS